MTTVPPLPDGIAIRPAERADLPAVERVERACFPQPWPAAAFAHYCGRPGFLVATDANSVIDVVGHVVCDTTLQDGRAVGHVKDLAVLPASRDRGIGSALLSRGLDVLSAADVAQTRLEVRHGNEAARSLYRRFGFTVADRDLDYYRDGEDAVIMVRDERARGS